MTFDVVDELSKLLIQYVILLLSSVQGPVLFQNGERVASIELRQFQGASHVSRPPPILNHPFIIVCIICIQNALKYK